MTDPAPKPESPRPESNVDRITAQLRRMAAEFEIKPDERIREGDMAKRLSVSRTPLREALNRLVSEGFLTFTGGQGFFCRSLTPERILDLYEARAAVECEAMRLAISRAPDADIRALKDELDRTEPLYETATDRIALLEMDEAFHMALTRLSRNAELTNMLDNINGRIRYVRMIGLNMARSDARRLSAHRAILDALTDRDEARALATLRAHIELRKEDATRAVREAFSHIYVQAG
ncbi:GntR family transcriptional regulator [Nioella sp.]|uniref:GntR family transcriptional regulator n=1 Tax=Nioella sp. TaxID=1912091 RepID=UPI003B527CA9